MKANIREYLSLGIRAPSGDNCQPWRFRFTDDNELHICVIPERAKSFFDYKHCGSYISVGAVIENIRTIASYHGDDVTVNYFGEVNKDLPAASLKFTPKLPNKKLSKKIEAIRKRTVNRRPYLPIKLTDQAINTLLSDPVDDIDIVVHQNRNSMKTWGLIIYIADLIRFTHPEIHSELFSKILFNKIEIDAKRLGLEYNRLGLGPASSVILRLLEPWERMEKLIKLGVHKIFAFQTRILAHAAGGIFSVRIKDTSPENWIKAGEQTQRIWIKAEEHGFCIQPLTVAFYLDQRYQSEGMKEFHPSHKKLLEKMRCLLIEQIEDGHGAMLFRIGHGWRMKNTAIRLPLEDFIQ